MEPPWLARDASEPLGIWTRTTRPPPAGEARRLPFEFSSRGDRVPGLLWLPATGRGPFALVLHQGASGAIAGSEGGNGVAAWLRAGAAVASIDLPLHGGRASAKLGGLLQDGCRGGPDRPALARALVVEFARQAVLDLQRSLDALPRVARLDPRRIAFVGAGIGASLGAHFCALDPRARAVVLAGAAGCLPAELDPRPSLARIAPRPVLLVEGEPGAPAARVVAFVCRALGLAEP